MVKIFRTVYAVFFVHHDQNDQFPFTEFGSNMLQQIYILPLSQWVPKRFHYRFTSDFEQILYITMTRLNYLGKDHMANSLG